MAFSVSNPGNVNVVKITNTQPDPTSSIVMFRINAATGAVTSTRLNAAQVNALSKAYLNLVSQIPAGGRGNVFNQTLNALVAVIALDNSGCFLGAAETAPGSGIFDVAVDGLNANFGSDRFAALYIPHSIPGGVVAAPAAAQAPIAVKFDSPGAVAPGANFNAIANVNFGNAQCTKIGVGNYNFASSSVNAADRFLAVGSCDTAGHVITFEFDGVNQKMKIRIQTNAGVAADCGFTFAYWQA